MVLTDIPLADLSVRGHGPVVTVQVSRPDVLNAFRAQTRAELASVLDAVRTDDHVRVVVLTGAGRAFSAGQDLRELGGRLQNEEASDDQLRQGIEELQDLTRALLALPQVTIAALNGVAVGLGAELALACDLRVAAESAAIGFPEARRAMFQTNGVMWLLPRIVGLSRANDLVLTGRLVQAAEAGRIGLVQGVCPDADLASTVEALAADIAANAPGSLRLAKHLLRDTWGLDLAQVMTRETEGMLACLRSRDLREGTLAFLDGRTPHYEGR
ncbi:enoyl-CoA hydratase/isomerase family protein [Microtetraspora fusca]|uniref:enoyl-CoA hydratase/isomerase family protein n=1 Tax=Microtetraspora fusca TaxID=1997 RepID=UPI0009FE3147|nr:enoyl-CoA hydratase/isomerase family protein [Microtetraspora fusca]